MFKGIEKITGFGMKNSSTLPSLANKCFRSLRDENDETIYTYNDDICYISLDKVLKAVNVEVSITIMNHLFLPTFSIFFQKN